MSVSTQARYCAMRLPPRMLTRRMGAMALPIERSTRVVSAGVPMTYTRSPVCGTNEPFGTMTSSPRLAAHMRMLLGFSRL